jgi:hypothetical protein
MLESSNKQIKEMYEFITKAKPVIEAFDLELLTKLHAEKIEEDRVN